MTRLVSEHFLHTGKAKRRYETRGDAVAAMEAANQADQQHVYRCKFCRGWHRATNKGAKGGRR